MAEPVRMCRVCRQRAPKSRLQRWILQDSQLLADPSQRAAGRGYYTDSQACAERLPKVLKLKSA